MPKWTRKEIQDHFGITSAYFTTNRNRGKVKVDEAGYIDDSDPVNERFLGKLRERKGAAPSKDQRNSEESPPENAAQAGNLLQIERETKAAELEKKQRESALLELKRQRQEGEVIPTIEVTKVFSQHFRNTVAAFEEASDNLIQEMAARKKMSDKDVADLRNRLVSIVNDAIDKATEASKKDIQAIVEEYSVKRERGERDHTA